MEAEDFSSAFFVEKYEHPLIKFSYFSSVICYRNFLFVTTL
jgi:hypothetical protein